MGCVMGKNGMSNVKPWESSTDGELKEKIRELERELARMRCKREQEVRGYEEAVQGLVAREAEWRREKKRWKEEMAEMKRRLEEKDESIRRLEKREEAMADKEWWQGLRASFVVEQMREEYVRTEEALVKWKKLYLTLKSELDDLILRAHQGEKLWWAATETQTETDTETETEDEGIEALQRELNAKEETIEALKKQISAMAKQGADRERELDILKQSLRILKHTL